MTASFTTTSGQEPLAAFRVLVQAAKPARSDLLYAGALLVTRIRDRTFAGTDASGAPFTPYSPGYAKKKAGKLGHGRVDLFGTANHMHMLNALQVVADSDESFGVGIYANEELEERARVHNEGLSVPTRLGKGRKQRKGGRPSFTMPQRRWLDASPEDVDAIGRAIEERIAERLKASGV